jgi:hypothetical protein
LTRVTDIPLLGAGGEPVDFARTIVSHGVAELPPNRVDVAARTFQTTLPVQRGARTIAQLHERASSFCGWPSLKLPAKAASDPSPNTSFRDDQRTEPGSSGQIQWRPEANS